MITNKEISKEIKKELMKKSNSKYYTQINSATIERIINYYCCILLILIKKGGFITLQSLKNDSKKSVIRVKPKYIDVVNHYNKQTSMYHAIKKRGVIQNRNQTQSPE